MIPENLKNYLKSQLRSNGLSNSSISGFSFSSGGCINSSGVLESGNKSFFLKWNDENRFPGIFSKEFSALSSLKASTSLMVPEPLLEGSFEGTGFLLMEHIQSGGGSRDYWKELAEGLAELHRNSSEKYGWKENNYIGSLVQKNEEMNDWGEFFAQKRLLEPLGMAVNSGIMYSKDLRELELAIANMKELLVLESPALIHGDLWSGNIMRGPQGQAVIIDPAIYYGHREIEIAFTTMFGGFDKDFYRYYQECFPMEKGYEKRFELYNLYPLLVHANLFGGGYISSARQLIKKYL